MQRQLKEKTLEAEKSRLTAMKMQDEVIFKCLAGAAPGVPLTQSTLPDRFQALLGETCGRFLRQCLCWIPQCLPSGWLE